MPGGKRMDRISFRGFRGKLWTRCPNVKAGGMMVYSTCTFSAEENEGTLKYILDNYPEMHVIPIEQDGDGLMPAPSGMGRRTGGNPVCETALASPCQRRGAFYRTAQERRRRQRKQRFQ